jgi:hypothetical protein
MHGHRFAPQVNRLLLAEGFRQGVLSSEDERLVLDGDPIEVVDLGFHRRRALPGAAHYNCPLAVDRQRGLVYFSDGDLFVLEVARGECVKVAGPPPVQVDPERVAQRRAMGSGEVHPEPRGAYYWLLALSPDGGELVSLYDAPDMTQWVVRVRPGSGVTGYWQMDSPPIGICADMTAGLIYHTDYDGRPRILDLDGRCVATLAPARIYEVMPELCHGDWFYSSAFRPGNSEIVLSADPGIVLWDHQHGRITRVDPDGLSPAWSPDGGTLYYMRLGEEELWRWRPDGEKERIAALEGPPLPAKHLSAWGPVPSPCGRYLYAQLRRETGGIPVTMFTKDRQPVDCTAEWYACVVDLVEKVIHVVPGEGHHNVAWLR